MSYDFAVIHWTTLHRKKWYDYRFNNTLAHTHKVIENIRVTSVFFIEIMFILKAIKSTFKWSYDKTVSYTHGHLV